MGAARRPDHVRDVDLFVRRYGPRAFGPWLFWRTNVPETELEPIEPGGELRVWAAPALEERAQRALERPPWTGELG